MLNTGVNFATILEMSLTVRLKTHNDHISYLNSQINWLGVSVGFDMLEDFRIFFWHYMIVVMFLLSFHMHCVMNTNDSQLGRKCSDFESDSSNTLLAVYLQY